MFCIHMFYYYTGNLLVPFTIGVALKIYGNMVKGEEQYDKDNLSRKSEKTFFND